MSNFVETIEASFHVGYEKSHNKEEEIFSWSSGDDSEHGFKIGGIVETLISPGFPVKYESSYLVPVAVMLCGVTVVLKHFGYSAFVDALKTQLPFT